MVRKYIKGIVDLEDVKEKNKTLLVDREDVIILLCKLQGKEIKDSLSKEAQDKKIGWLMDNLRSIKKQFA